MTIAGYLEAWPLDTGGDPILAFYRDLQINGPPWNGQLGVGVALPSDALGAGVLSREFLSPLGCTFGWNWYSSGAIDKYLTNGGAAALCFDGATLTYEAAPAGAAGQQALFNLAMSLTAAGRMFLPDTLEVSRDPALAMEVATKQYVDQLLSGYMPLTGGILTGGLQGTTGTFSDYVGFGSGSAPNWTIDSHYNHLTFTPSSSLNPVDQYVVMPKLECNVADVSDTLNTNVVRAQQGWFMGPGLYALSLAAPNLNLGVGYYWSWEMQSNALNLSMWDDGGQAATVIGVPISILRPSGAILLQLPSSDPGVAGQLWNNGGVVNISAGP